MPVIGSKLVLRNIIKFETGFVRHVNRTMTKVKTVLDAKVTENLSGGLTPEYMRLIDHPYARRHGLRGKEPLTPWYKVNKQSGRLKRSKTSGTTKAIPGNIFSAEAYVKLDEAKAPHAIPVIYGTSRMIPRPVLQGSLDEVSPVLVGILKTNLRNAVINS